MSNQKNNIPTPTNTSVHTKHEGLLALNQQLIDDEVEQTLAQHFDNEAAEGLATLPQAKADTIIQNLNTTLQKKLQKNKRRTKALQSQQNIFVLIVILLLLIIISFVIITKLLT